MLVALETVNVGEVNRRDENNCRLLEARMLPDDLGKFEAVDLRHADIHQHGRHVHLEKLFERILGGCRLDKVLVEFAEDGLIAEQFARLVVHHQDIYFVVGLHWLINVLPGRVGAGLLLLTKTETHTHRCSHIRNAERSCSVLTGFAKYSEAPASRHFSRSPFIAFAVRAMMGSLRNAAFWRITCMVA